MRGDRRADRRKGSPGFPSSSFYGGSLPGGSTRSDRALLCACVRPAGAGRVNRAEEGHFRLAYDAPGQPESVCRAGLPQGGVGCGRGVPWREDGSKRDRAQKAHSGEKERWPSASGGLERRKERPCGRSRCVQDDAGRLQRLTGDNVRPLMRPAPRQGGSAGGQYAKRSMKAHPGGTFAVRQRRCA